MNDISIAIKFQLFRWNLGQIRSKLRAFKKVCENFNAIQLELTLNWTQITHHFRNYSLTLLTKINVNSFNEKQKRGHHWPGLLIYRVFQMFAKCFSLFMPVLWCAAICLTIDLAQQLCAYKIKLWAQSRAIDREWRPDLRRTEPTNQYYTH